MVSSALYSDQMKSIFGFSNGQNSFVKNARLSRESLERMEIDQLDSTHDQLDVQEEQLKVLKKIAKHVASGQGGLGGGGLGLLEAYVGYKGVKGLAGKLFKPAAGAAGLAGTVGSIFKTGTSQVISWSKNVTGGITGALASSRVAVRGLRSGMTAKITSAINMLSGTILSSFSGLLASIGSIFKSGMAKAGKLASKLMIPLTAAFAAYEGYQGYRKAGEIDKSGKLNAAEKTASGVVNATDSFLLGIPSLVQEYLTGEDLVTATTRRTIEEKQFRLQRKKLIEDARRNSLSDKQRANEDAWDKAGGWGGTWQEFKQAIGVSSEEDDAQIKRRRNNALQVEISRNLASKRRNETNPLVGTLLDAVEVGAKPVISGSSATTVGAVAEATAQATLKEANSNSWFTYTDPATKKTYSYLEIATGIWNRQLEVLQDIYNKTDEQLDVAKKALAQALGLDESTLKRYIDSFGGDTRTTGEILDNGRSGTTHKGIDEVTSPSSMQETVKDQTVKAPSILDGTPLRDNATYSPISGDMKLSEYGAYKEITSVPNASVGGVKGSGTAVDVMNTLMANGVSKRDAAAMVGNFHVESGGFSSGVLTGKVRGDSGSAGYMAQWRHNRQDNLKAFAKEKGLDLHSANTQALFALEESTAGSKYADNQAVAAYNWLKNNPNASVEKATEVFMKGFERPNADPRINHIGRRQEIAGKFASLDTVPGGIAGINPRLLQSELGGFEGIKLPNIGGGAVDAASVVKQSQDRLAGIRKQPITDALQQAIAEQVRMTFGEGYRAEVYSGGQAAKGTSGKRTGSTRHDLGNAADVKIYAPDGSQVTSQLDLGRFTQGWLAEKRGGVGTIMRGGGIHLDTHKNRAPWWSYSRQGGPNLTSAFIDMKNRGLRGERPDYVMSREEAQKSLSAASQDLLKTAVVQVKDISLKEQSRGSRGLGRLLSNDKYAARFKEDITNPFDNAFKPKGIDIYNKGIPSSLTPEQEAVFKMQGTEIAKGLVDAERSTPKMPDFNPQVQSNAIFNAVDSAPVRGSENAKSPTGNANTTMITPKDIPHTDELTMLMANSQMMG